MVVSAGWFSSREIPEFRQVMVPELIQRGYTVFAVTHGSQPRYTISDAVADVDRAVRYVRFHAKDFAIDPERIGITGASAGGHLSLMQGVAGRPGDPKAKAPVQRTSSRVQAVACFFPPTDFLNYGKEGKIELGGGLLGMGPFDFRELDPKTRAHVPITDAKRRLEIGRSISPVHCANKDAPPTLIVHGDADTLVPLQQSERFVARMKEVGAPVQLLVRPAAGHSWELPRRDMPTIGDWFDKHLRDSAREKTR